MHVKILNVLCMLASVSLISTMAETNTPTPYVGIFSKTLTNGAQVVIEKQRTIEVRNTQNGPITTTLPTNFFYLKGEYITDSFRLISTKAGKAEVVWTKEVMQSAIRLPDYEVMTVLDVEEFGLNMFVLFSSKGLVVLNVMAKNTSGQWEVEAERVLGRVTTLDGSGRIVQHGSDIVVVIKHDNGSEETIPGYIFK